MSLFPHLQNGPRSKCLLQGFAEGAGEIRNADPLVLLFLCEALGVMLRQMLKKPLSWSLPPRSSRSASNWDLKTLKQETLLQQCHHF